MTGNDLPSQEKISAALLGENSLPGPSDSLYPTSVGPAPAADRLMAKKRYCGWGPRVKMSHAAAAYARHPTTLRAHHSMLRDATLITAGWRQNMYLRSLRRRLEHLIRRRNDTSYYTSIFCAGRLLSCQLCIQTRNRQQKYHIVFSCPTHPTAVSKSFVLAASSEHTPPFTSRQHGCMIVLSYLDILIGLLLDHLHIAQVHHQRREAPRLIELLQPVLARRPKRQLQPKKKGQGQRKKRCRRQTRSERRRRKPQRHRQRKQQPKVWLVCGWLETNNITVTPKKRLEM